MSRAALSMVSRTPCKFDSPLILQPGLRQLSVIAHDQVTMDLPVRAAVLSPLQKKCRDDIPAPRGEWISYGPIFVSVCNAMCRLAIEQIAERRDYSASDEACNENVHGARMRSISDDKLFDGPENAPNDQPTGEPMAWDVFIRRSPKMRSHVTSLNKLGEGLGIVSPIPSRHPVARRRRPSRGNGFRRCQNLVC